jgi:hypothetical protein
METVSILFARRDSIYKELAGCDVWDIDRDARTFDGPGPVVAHPPCRAWGRHDHRPHVTKAEREHTPPELAKWLVELARRCRPSIGLAA